MASNSANQDAATAETAKSASEAAALADFIGAVGAKDRGAFKALYQSAAPKLFAIVLRILRDRSLAEDVLQDVFLKIWQNAESFAPEAGTPMAWLIAIARNRAIDVLRTRKLAPVGAASDTTELLENLAACGDRETEMTDLFALRRCLGEIEEPARSCLLLAYYEGYSREELASRYDRPVNTIKTWLFRSLIALKSCLEVSA